MNKRVYKFTRADHGISSIENKRLKLSTINDLNDPFDLCPVDTTDPAISGAVDTLTKELWKKTGVLCFSRNWDNLLLWSHYGASHTGICLGFDIPERQRAPVAIPTFCISPISCKFVGLETCPMSQID